ncbi:hypothetical protein K502DRAFT_343635 [Neoconidiobolus thromboides FSU 785]|nr:hypothetical protein K502DRAFT_343635 [Neoconidiobolus thromboides FSU 785]
MLLTNKPQSLYKLVHKDLTQVIQLRQFTSIITCSNIASKETWLNKSIDQHSLELQKENLGFGLYRQKKREAFSQLFFKINLPPRKKESSLKKEGDGLKFNMKQHIFGWLNSEIELINQDSNKKEKVMELIHKINQRYIKSITYPLMIRYVVEKYENEHNILDEIFTIYCSYLYELKNVMGSQEIPNHMDSKDNLRILNMVIKIYGEMGNKEKLEAVKEVIEAFSISDDCQLESSFSLAYCQTMDYELSKYHLLKSLQFDGNENQLSLFNNLLKTGVKQTEEVKDIQKDSKKEIKKKDYFQWLQQYLDFLYPPTSIPGKNINIYTILLRLQLCNDSNEFSHLINLSDQLTLLNINKKLKYDILKKATQLNDITNNNLLSIYYQLINCKKSFNFRKKKHEELNANVIKDTEYQFNIQMISLLCKRGMLQAAFKLAIIVCNNKNIKENEKKEVFFQLIKCFERSNEMDENNKENENKNNKDIGMGYGSDFKILFGNFLYKNYMINKEWNIPKKHLEQVMRIFDKLEKTEWKNEILKIYFK